MAEGESFFHWMKDMISWWCWRRWRIYCPKKDIYQFSKEYKMQALFDWEEAYISPCSWHPINSGNPPGIKPKRIGFMPAMIDREKN